MSKAFKPQIISANDLLGGGVVYLTAQYGWSDYIAEAAQAFDRDAAAALLVHADQPGKVVGPYLLDVTLDDGTVQPDHFRERFRETGPTLHAGFARHKHLPSSPDGSAKQGSL
jgi:hypothetical protein